jgi:hypothetical protein
MRGVRASDSRDRAQRQGSRAPSAVPRADVTLSRLCTHAPTSALVLQRFRLTLERRQACIV